MPLHPFCRRRAGGEQCSVSVWLVVGSARAREVASRLLCLVTCCAPAVVSVCAHCRWRSPWAAWPSSYSLWWAARSTRPSPTRPTRSGWTGRSLQVVHWGGGGGVRGGVGANGGWHSHHCHTTGLWNNVFLVSNVCLLLLLPFGHFFMEAEGFTWSRKVSTAAAVHASCPAHPVCPVPAPGPVVQGVRVLSGGGTDGGVAGAGGLGGLLPLAARQHPK